jgi:hypothetical protein
MFKYSIWSELYGEQKTLASVENRTRTLRLSASSLLSTEHLYVVSRKSLFLVTSPVLQEYMDS